MCFTGYPLAGKSALAKKMAGDRYPLLETGKIAREILDAETYLRECSQSNICISANKEIVRRIQNLLNSDAETVVLDGCPRSFENVHVLEECGRDVEIW